MRTAARNLLLGTVAVGVLFAAKEVYDMAMAAKELAFAPGKLKLGVPFNSYNVDAKKMETYAPVEAIVKITNQTGTALSFQHPLAKVSYRNTDVAVSEVSTLEHTLVPYANGYQLKMKFNVNIEKLGDSVKDAAQYLTKRLLGQQVANRVIKLDMAIHAYGITFPVTLDYKI